MAIVSFIIADLITKKEITKIDNNSDLIGGEIQEITIKGQELLNQGTTIKKKNRYKLEYGRHSLYYYAGQSNSFYLCIVKEIHHTTGIEDLVFALIKEVDDQKIITQLDNNDKLTFAGKHNLNSIIVKYQEYLKDTSTLARSETLESMKNYQTTELNIKEEVVNTNTSYNNKNMSGLAESSAYSEDSRSLIIYFRIARVIVWSLSFVITIISILLILDNY